MEKKLAFMSNRTGNFDIFSVDIDGKNLKNLTDSPENNYMPAWSPDNEFLAYTSRENAMESIFVVKSDGTGKLKITSGKSWKDTSPLWARDGTKIAFLSNRTGLNEIYRVNPEGTELFNLTDNKIDEKDFSWSPDGTKIVFTGRYEEQTDLYIMDSDGNNQRKLTNDKGIEYDFSWSPDGEKIVFTTTQYTDGVANISVVDIKSGNILNLTSDNVWKRYPLWSPDGSSLIFCAGTQVPTYLYGFNFSQSLPVKIVGGQASNEEPDWVEIKNGQ